MFQSNKNKYKLNNQNKMSGYSHTTRYSFKKINDKPISSSIDNLLNQMRQKNKIIKNERVKLKNQNKAKLQSFTSTNFQNLNEYKKLNSSVPKVDINIILGRKVNNLSKNKFKFIKKKPSTNTNSSHYQVNLLKLDNRIKKRRKLFINPFLLMRQYNSPSHLIKKHSIINIKGVKYNLNKNGKKLKRLRTASTSTNRFKLNNVKPKFIAIRAQNTQKALEKVFAKLVFFFFFVLLLHQVL